MSSSTPPANSPTSPPVTNATTPPSPPPPPNNATNTSAPETPTGSLSPPAPPVVQLPPPVVQLPPPAVQLPPPANGNMQTGALAGLIVGLVLGGVIVLVAVGICVIFFRRRKRKEGHGAESFSGGPPEGPKDDPLQHWQQNASSPMDNKDTMLPKPTPTPAIAANPHLSAVPVPTLPETSSTSSSLGSEKPLQPLSPGITLGFSQSTFTYKELAMATDGFSDANLLGQGGFGFVHRGVLPNGKVVAIKQLKAGSRQGEREFQAEVEIISRVHHRHLVSLVGYCIAGAQRMLVYEFVPNNTLEFHLHGKGRPIMEWPTRIKIAIGSAKGLAYLHEDCQPKIIHRDIKASNILLDNSFEAKVADFGLAKFSLDTDTHVSTRVMGTFGYLAPEYASTGKLTDKSDVYSFGVVLLELITGRRPVDRTQMFIDDSIVDWARPLLTQALEDGNFDAIIDPRLQKNYNSSEMARMAACAAACVRHSSRVRPRMSQIIRALEGNMSLDDLNEGVNPGHSTIYNSYSSYGSSTYGSTQYKEDLKKFRKVALESQAQGSSEYSGHTSERGLNPSSSSTEGQRTTQEPELQKTDSDTKTSSESL